MACHPVGLEIADDPSSWASAGFRVSAANTVALGEITLALVGRHRSQEAGGLVGWRFAGLPHGFAGAIDGIPTAAAEAAEAVGGGEEAEPHPNGAVAVDHIVCAHPPSHP